VAFVSRIDFLKDTNTIKKKGDHYVTKSKLVEQMAKDAGISKSAANAALNSFTDCITKALMKKDGKVTLVGFGTFSKYAEKPAKVVIPRPLKRLKSRHPIPLSSKLGRS